MKTHPDAIPPRVGLAFQGGSFLAGAIDAGVVQGLVDSGAFQRYTINAFSGTSAGALVAAVCWRHALQDRMADAPAALRQQWLHNAYGIVPNAETADFLKLLDFFWSATNRLYFQFKDAVMVPTLQWLFRLWVDKFVEPETCMRLLYERYVLPSASLADAETKYQKDSARPHLIVGATRVVDSEDVNFSDEEFFAGLISALHAHPADADAAIQAAAEHMRQGIMASGSIDFINGMTTVESGAFAGTYLDGAWAENPPLNGLLDAGVDQIWMVEVFPKRCAAIPDTFVQREDRREELWQNAVVEQQLHFINKINDWLADGSLTNKKYRPVETHCISLPPEMQCLTAGARLVNSPAFLIDKIEFGRANALCFLSTLP